MKVLKTGASYVIGLAMSARTAKVLAGTARNLVTGIAIAPL